MAHPVGTEVVKCPWVAHVGGRGRILKRSRLRYAVDGRYHFPPTDLMYVCFLFLCLAVLFSKVTNVPGFHVIKLRNLVKLVSTTFS